MCGRFAFFAPAEALVAAFGLESAPALAPRFNIAPSQEVVTVRLEEGRRVAEYLRWGLVPFWAKDPAVGHRMINARAETLAEKPSFRQALRKRRCLIPASGFYEWVTRDGGKQPWFISPAEAEFMCFAGLWETWQAPDGELRTCTIVTTAATPFMAPLHQRMPLVLAPEHYGDWLNPDNGSARYARLLGESPAIALQAWPVSRRVNSPLNEGEELINEAAAAG